MAYGRSPLELIQQLDSSIAHSTDERRSAMLRHLTDLFLVGSDQYSDDEIDLIDDVFMRLVTTIEESSRALLAIRLGVIERNMRETNTQSLLVLVKAIGLSWETTRSIMTLAPKRYRRSLAGIDQAMPSFSA